MIILSVLILLPRVVIILCFSLMGLSSGELPGDANNTQQPAQSDEQGPTHLKQALTILEEDEKEEKYFSDPIQPEMASSWTKILQSGLSAESMSDMIKKYLPPENCAALDPPKINMKVWKALPENTIRRDLRLSNLQSQMGAATSELGFLFNAKLRNRVAFDTRSQFRYCRRSYSHSISSEIARDSIPESVAHAHYCNNCINSWLVRCLF